MNLQNQPINNSTLNINRQVNSVQNMQNRSTQMSKNTSNTKPINNNQMASTIQNNMNTKNIDFAVYDNKIFVFINNLEENE